MTHQNGATPKVNKPSALQDMRLKQIHNAAAGIFPKLQEVTDAILIELRKANVAKADEGMVIALMAALTYRCKVGGVVMENALAEFRTVWDTIQIKRQGQDDAPPPATDS